jgi:hypothetical protein
MLANAVYMDDHDGLILPQGYSPTGATVHYARWQPPIDVYLGYPRPVPHSQYGANWLYVYALVWRCPSNFGTVPAVTSSGGVEHGGVSVDTGGYMAFTNMGTFDKGRRIQSIEVPAEGMLGACRTCRYGGPVRGAVTWRVQRRPTLYWAFGNRL